MPFSTKDFHAYWQPLWMAYAGVQDQFLGKVPRALVVLKKSF